MQKIQELFDANKQLNRKIESVVTFAAHSNEELSEEIKEYVVTKKLHDNYENVVGKIEEAFSDGAKEVGIWVSGFYGSGKSSFAKYLGYSFDSSLLIDGVSFGEKLMSRIQDEDLRIQHRTLVQRYNPLVVLIDMSTQATAGKSSKVSDIIYYETMKALGITTSNDPKVLEFMLLVYEYDKYDQLCEFVRQTYKSEWVNLQDNGLFANRIIAKAAPILFPDLFSSEEDYTKLQVDSMENEVERFKKIKKFVKKFKNKDKIIFVLDEVGQFIASDKELILNLQGVMHILKDNFKGDVWLIATAQQTLTEDNPDAQLNSSLLYTLNDRFPIKVDIEADDIKEIITKRILGKSVTGKAYLTKKFSENEAAIKLATRLVGMDRSIYLRPLDEDNFSNLYPFIPVHIDILMALLQKLASRTGGVGLRSVIRLIRDILVDNKLADAPIGQLAGPEHFYDVLRIDMEKNKDFKEIILSAQKAIGIFSGDELTVRICKTIAVMQVLDDFSLTFDNLCALLYNHIGRDVDKTKIRQKLEDIKSTEGVTLQEIDGKFRFMTNAILGIQEERSRIAVMDSQKVAVMKELVLDMFNPAPSINLLGTKTINVGVDLTEGRHPYTIIASQGMKINLRFVPAVEYDAVKASVQTESTKPENNLTVFWICSLPKDNKEVLLQDIVKGDEINNRHRGETNKEVLDYLKAQKDNSKQKKRDLQQLLLSAQGNSEMVFRGSAKQVNADNYTAESLRPAAETIYNKYHLASTSMKGTCVESLGQFEDFTTIPPALNPFGIIKSDGTIDTANLALAEIKDFISAKADANGNEVLAKFDIHPYGWSKDTTRYLVALMLKAGIIIIKSSGKVFKIFSKNAAEEMKSNVSFGKIGVSLNNDDVPKPQELLKAVNNLKSLFNPSKPVPPQADSIAKETLKQMNGSEQPFRADIERILRYYIQYQLSGSEMITKAQSFCKQIIDSEGTDAPKLLSRVDECVKSFQFVKENRDAEKKSALFSTIASIIRNQEDIAKLADIPDIQEFKQKDDQITESLNTLRANPNPVSVASEYRDLLDELQAAIRAICTDFETSVGQKVAEEVEKILQRSEYDSLKDEQKAVIQSIIAKYDISHTEDTVAQLHEMINVYVAFKMTGNNEIPKAINKFVLANAAEEAEAHPENGEDGEPENPEPETPKPTPKPIRHTIKKQLSTRYEVMDVIDFLNDHIDDVDAGSSIELSLSE